MGYLVRGGGTREDLNYWADKDRATNKKVRALLNEVLRRRFDGIGKPEPLKHKLGNVWSRRVSQEHRLVYAVEDQQIVVLAARFHYGEWCLRSQDRSQEVEVEPHWCMWPNRGSKRHGRRV